MQKPELLLPVGNTETFNAAVDGGANAVYLGLRSFNARGRASNFSHAQLWALLQVAKKKGVRVLLTLNTLIKNEELPQLLEFLHFISKTKLDAIIVQDWGVYYLVKKYFPNITLHASTQLGIHNSIGTNHLKQKGFKRAVLARELTFGELTDIRKKSDIELEVFVHGALCYSFSGMCLFSSFLGGSGANRGLCAQPCRRNFFSEGQGSYLFSLRDNEQIDLVPEFSKMGIDSLKVEGRMKSAEYVNTVAKAYREAIDDFDKVKDAKELLSWDTGREKTKYFLGGDASDAITQNTNTGIHIGHVVRTDKDGFYIKVDQEIEKGYRLRIKSLKTDSQVTIKIKEEVQEERGLIFIPCLEEGINKGDSVFIAARGTAKFSNKLPNVNMPYISIPHGLRNKILSSFKDIKSGKEDIFVRVDSIKWISKVHFPSIEGLIVNLSKSEWEEFNFNTPFLVKNKDKIIIELPKFIPEKSIPFWQKLCKSSFRKGYTRFMLSHVSQKQLLHPKAITFTNENVYALNDAAVTFLKREENIKLYSYPLENDFMNLKYAKDKTGIVPVYFRPDLFYSRMPVEIPENSFTDDKDNNYMKFVKNGITIVIPENPVVLMQYADKLKREGFRRFLIDLSYEKPSSNIFKSLIKKFKDSRQIQPSYNFNFKMGLK